MGNNCGLNTICITNSEKQPSEPMLTMLMGTFLWNKVMSLDVQDFFSFVMWRGCLRGSVITSYRWYHSCSTGICEVRRESPYHTPVNDTLLVDATTWGGGRRRHFCEVNYLSQKETSITQRGFTTLIRLRG